MDKEEALASLKSSIPVGQPPLSPGRGQRRGSFLRATGGIALLALIAILLWIFIPSGSGATDGRDRVRVLRVAGIPSADSSQAILTAAGYVVARRKTTVSSRITGMIRAVYVQEGMAVHRGQILARLAARSARANVALARQQLQADQALVRSALAQLALDQKNWIRIRTLYSQGLESRSAYDQARTTVALDRANLMHDEAGVSAARSQLNLAEITLDHTLIRAPFSGIVTAKYANRGEMISPAAVGGFTKTGICQLVDMQSLEMDVDVNESFIDRVHAGEPTRIVLNAYPSWRIPGHVISVVPTADRNKGTVKVRVAFQHLSPKLLPEMAGEVYFYSRAPPTTVRSRPVVLPRHAIFDTRSKPFVWLVEAGRIVKTPVHLLSRPDARQVSVTGLSPGARVVIGWSSRIHDGERVEIRHGQP